MKLVAWEQLKIGTRVLAITLLPVLAMFCFVAFSTYYFPLEEADQELAERGHLLAAALAESGDARAETGDAASLMRVARNLAQSDSSICSIRILDTSRREAFHVDFNEPADVERREFDAPIRALGFAAGAAAGPMRGQVKGYAVVTISLSKLVERQKHKIYEQSALALLAILAIAALVLWLTRSLTGPLDAAVASLRAIRSGDFNVRVDHTTGGEIGELQSAIVDMAHSLQLSKEDLENQVLTRTRDLEASRNLALRSDAEKRKLIHKVNTIVEDERKSIAIEIHDVLNADLIAVRLDSQRILKLASGPAQANAFDEIRTKAQAIIDTTLGIYASARSIVRRLRPEVLETLGLHGAVEEMVRHYDLAHPVCKFFFQSDGDFLKLESSLAIAAYRLIQEALSNVVKHSKASKCSVSLLAEEDTMLKITIIDNGMGFDMQAMNQGIGLIGMRERVYAVGGKIDIRSGVGHGTEIVICFAY